ncbi:ABC transporter ATP-binding protein, partial [Mesorhizobium sp. M8A.F.Ca.ET.023.02.2.1]
FSHSRREAAFAREGMMGFLDTVYRSMRLVTVLFGSLYILNALLLFSVTAISLWLWMGQAVTIGAVAVVIGLVLRMWGMSQWIMWEMSGLFENIGTVQDGIASISLPRLVEDRPDAREINVSKGDIRFEDIRFHYGKQKGVIENLSLAVKPGEKVGIVGRSGAGKSTLVNLLLRFYDLE